MLEETPALAGVYLDSISGWVSRYPNYREEHFASVDHPLTYDAETGRVCADGWEHTYEFMKELQRRLAARGKLVFPNLGRGRTLPFLYFVTDVVGLESGLHGTDYEARLNYYRTLAYQKPVLVMQYLEVLGRPTELSTPEGFERLWKWCALYGVHPSIGRACDTAWERHSALYRRFREPVRRIAAAGWEPVTHARASDPRVRIERFGQPKDGVYLTLLNTAAEPVQTRLEVDTKALGLPERLTARDLLDGREFRAPFTLSLAPDEIRILHLQPSGRAAR